MDLAPMTLEEREGRLTAAGATISMVSGGPETPRPAGEPQEPIPPACEVVLGDGRRFFAFGTTGDEARAEAVGRAEEALGLAAAT